MNKYILFIVFLCILNGCIGNMETPFLETQGYNDLEHYSNCSNGHIANVKDFSSIELFDACYAPNSFNNSTCWMVYNNRAVQVVAFGNQNTVVVNLGSIDYLYANTLCTNK